MFRKDMCLSLTFGELQKFLSKLWSLAVACQVTLPLLLKAYELGIIITPILLAQKPRFE